MKPLPYAGSVLALCACVAGCAAPGAAGTSSGTTATTRLSGTRLVSANDVNAIAIGKSTKADVVGALGKTTVISFDSGFEVWVYQTSDDNITGVTAAGKDLPGRIAHAGSENAAPVKTEFVVLIAPSGVVTKIRVRPVPLPVTAKGA